MTDETYKRLMLRHATVQTALLWGLLASKIKGSDQFDSIEEDVVSICDATDEELNWGEET